MKKITGVIKINILSLVAIPLLLLAVGVKMLSKALDKIMFLIGTAVILLGAWLSSIILQLPSEVLNTVLTVILIVVICAVITLIIVLLFRVASGVITTASTFVIDFLNRIYELFYRGYSALYHRCRQCYEEQLSEMTNPNLKKVLCLFYSILRVVNECIIFFATHALKLLILVIILLVVGTLFLLDRQTHAILGLNLFTTLGLFSVRDVLASAVPYAASVFCIGTLLISVGLEWNEWGREMKMATTDYEGYLNKIAEIRARLDETGEGASQKGAVQRCKEYMDKLNQHFAEAEMFRAETQSIIQRSENQVLRSLLGEYMNTILQLSEKTKGGTADIAVKDFKKLIPKVKRLDSLKADIRKLNMKLASYTPSRSETGFFAGCDSLAKLEKRYKALCKTYHPDSEAGDEETFKKMKEEYEELKEKLGE